MFVWLMIYSYIDCIETCRSFIYSVWGYPNTGIWSWNKRLEWWRHQMETFSALLAICAENSPVPGEFPAQRPVTRNFGVFLDLRPNKRLSKQSWGWWFETPSHPLWRHRNGIDCYYTTTQHSKSRNLRVTLWPLGVVGHFEIVILKHILFISGSIICYEIAPIWMAEDPTDQKPSKPIPEPMLTQIKVAIWCQRFQ